MRTDALTQHDLQAARCRCGRPGCSGTAGIVPIACPTDRRHPLAVAYDIASRTIVVVCVTCEQGAAQIAVAPDVIECEAAMGVA